MRSMTGMGTGRARSNGLSAEVELRSVNHRFLDVSFRLPPAFVEFEPGLRDLLQHEIDRARVTVLVTFEQTVPDLKVSFNEPFIEAFVAEARRIARDHNLSDDLGLAEVAAMDDAFTVQSREIPAKVRKQLLDEAFGKALAQYQKMRKSEGRKLGLDLLRRLKTIEQSRKAVKSRAPMIAKELHRKLSDRIERMGAKDAVDPQRLAAEVAILVDKATIEEEIDRLESHVSQFKEAVNEGGPVAKRLGFLLQEMHREVNTIGSKSVDLEVTDAVMRMKEEVENLREQIQNLE